MEYAEVLERRNIGFADLHIPRRGPLTSPFWSPGFVPRRFRLLCTGTSSVSHLLYEAGITSLGIYRWLGIFNSPG